MTEICPYDCNHRIHKFVFPKHLVSCAQKHPHIEVAHCPFNRMHVLPRHRLAEHLNLCADRYLIEGEVSQRPSVNLSPQIQGRILPSACTVPEFSSKEVWDDEQTPMPALCKPIAEMMMEEYPTDDESAESEACGAASTVIPKPRASRHDTADEILLMAGDSGQYEEDCSIRLPQSMPKVWLKLQGLLPATESVIHGSKVPPPQTDGAPPRLSMRGKPPSVPFPATVLDAMIKQAPPEASLSARNPAAVVGVRANPSVVPLAAASAQRLKREATALESPAAGPEARSEMPLLPAPAVKHQSTSFAPSVTARKALVNVPRLVVRCAVVCTGGGDTGSSDETLSDACSSSTITELNELAPVHERIQKACKKLHDNYGTSPVSLQQMILEAKEKKKLQHSATEGHELVQPNVEQGVQERRGRPLAPGVSPRLHTNGCYEEVIRSMEPNKTNAQEVAPKLPIGQQVTPPSARRQQVTPPSARGRQVTPPSAKDQEITPASARGQQVSPPSARGQQITPASANGQQVTPPSAKDQEITPASAIGQQVAPPSASDQQVTPASAYGQQVTPASASGLQVTPASAYGQQVTPASANGQKVTVTPPPAGGRLIQALMSVNLQQFAPSRGPSGPQLQSNRPPAEYSSRPPDDASRPPDVSSSRPPNVYSSGPPNEYSSRPPAWYSSRPPDDSSWPPAGYSSRPPDEYSSRPPACYSSRPPGRYSSRPPGGPFRQAFGSRCPQFAPSRQAVTSSGPRSSPRNRPRANFESSHGEGQRNQLNASF